MDFCNFTDKKDIFVAKRILRDGDGCGNSTMKVLIFDTETTGLPKTRVKALLQRNNWPHIVSISWLVMDSNTNEILTQKSYVVKPDGWEIPEESTKIHGISTEFAEMTGAPLKDVMRDFLETPRDMIVAHNLEFDENVVINAIVWDLGDHSFYGFEPPKYCTMIASTEMCRLKPRFGAGFKSPKLSELYEHVFRTKPILAQLHGSMYDAKILSDILIASPILRSKIGLRVAPVLSGNENRPKTDTVLYL
jgi:DNA polymerase III epsilon subunit-like protein